MGAAFAGGLGAGLLFAALVAPKTLVPVQQAWTRFSHALSKVTTPVFMGCVYLLVISVIGFLARAFGHNAIRRPASSTSHWVSARKKRNEKDSMERQF